MKLVFISHDALFFSDSQLKSLQSDGYNVYMYLDDELMEVEHLCCLAHASLKILINIWLMLWEVLKTNRRNIALHLSNLGMNELKEII